MRTNIPRGIWPTMVTPYKQDGQVDYDTLGKLTDWYIERGVNGLFAVCQSSEMFALSLEERVNISAFVKERAGERVPVIASGHISDTLEDQAVEIKAIASTGVDAFVMVSNRLARQEENDSVWFANLERLLSMLPETIRLGFYECPYPYKRLITPEMLRRCADTGRFYFLKDTCCDIDMLRDKIDAVAGSNLNIYNANSATLWESLQMGIAGYSGVMANFHPELYVKLYNEREVNPTIMKCLSDFLSLSAFIEKQHYPINAKYYLQLEGVLPNYMGRTKNEADLSATYKLEVEQLRHLTQLFKNIAEGKNPLIQLG